MRKQEAAWIGERLRVLEGQRVVLNLGSGSKRFREVSKPYIDRDIFDPAVQSRLRDLHPQTVLACNIMEHLPMDCRDQFPGILDALVPPGGVLVITVPYSYPYHADPIDTLYRPSPKELCALFPGYEVLEARTIESESYGDEFVAGGPVRMVRKVLRMFFPFVRPKRWFSHAHRMLWLFRPYKLSGVVLRKPLNL